MFWDGADQAVSGCGLVKVDQNPSYFEAEKTIGSTSELAAGIRGTC